MMIIMHYHLLLLIIPRNSQLLQDISCSTEILLYNRSAMMIISSVGNGTLLLTAWASKLWIAAKSHSEDRMVSFIEMTNC